MQDNQSTSREVGIYFRSRIALRQPEIHTKFKLIGAPYKIFFYPDSYDLDSGSKHQKFAACYYDNSLQVEQLTTDVENIFRMITAENWVPKKPNRPPSKEVQRAVLALVSCRVEVSLDNINFFEVRPVTLPTTAPSDKEADSPESEEIKLKGFDLAKGILLAIAKKAIEVKLHPNTLAQIGKLSKNLRIRTRIDRSSASKPELSEADSVQVLRIFAKTILSTLEEPKTANVQPSSQPELE